MNVQFNFVSTYRHTLDEKGRLALPGKMRDELQKSENSEEMTCYHDVEGGFLVLYPKERWDILRVAIDNIDDYGERSSAQWRYGGNSEDVKIDKNGRFLVPPRLRENLDFGKEIVIRGAFNSIMLWPAAKVDAEEAKNMEIIKANHKKWNLPR